MDQKQNFNYGRYVKSHAKMAVDMSRQNNIPVLSASTSDGRSADEKWFNHLWDLKHMNSNPYTREIFLNKKDLLADDF